ncbi:c-type cytochrome biogenesis protein CcmI [Acidisphaera sp. L21]|uniref:c-type cytochrome biogenesis protein CcmI n=1 Tax=Acidisphaera sp. L21 TaxID=1641851 RepID=UPI00131A7699|nr:c-type cytochrome biogenesis protein CcmI [Acidisphaera sp. L21]
MIWLAAAILALCALSPAGWMLRNRIRVRGRNEAAIALYRAQIVELDRDLAEQRIAPTDHATAMLELQRRLLAASEAVERPGQTPDRGPLVLGLILVPMLALVLYLISGRPDLPSQPLAERIQAADAHLAEADQAATQLRAALAAIDPASPRAREGQIMLGNVEASRGRFAQAATAWRTALAQHFDPVLAAMTADAASRAEGKISPASAALYHQALAAAPADAPWRGEIEQRLATAPPP